MRRLFGLAGALALLAATAPAQEEAGRKMKIELERISSVLGPLHMGGPSVRGAPFAGQEIRESNQVLADGTRIHNESKAMVYRDSEGRMRRENGDQVTITDPVAGAAWVLDAKAMTAEKLPAGRFFYRQAGTAPGLAAGGASARRNGDGAGSNVSVKDGMVTFQHDGKTETFPVPPNGEWTSPDGKAHVVVRQSHDASAASSSVSTFNTEGRALVITRDGRAETAPLLPEALADKLKAEIAASAGAPGVMARRSNGNTEDLGEQMIEGLKSRGTRSTVTIEAGAIGNDRPLNTVSESWYSEELKMEIMSRRSDPRTGESSFRLSNVTRAEPPAYLFQVPAGYTVTER